MRLPFIGSASLHLNLIFTANGSQEHDWYGNSSPPCRGWCPLAGSLIDLMSCCYYLGSYRFAYPVLVYHQFGRRVCRIHLLCHIQFLSNVSSSIVRACICWSDYSYFIFGVFIFRFLFPSFSILNMVSRISESCSIFLSLVLPSATWKFPIASTMCFQRSSIDNPSISRVYQICMAHPNTSMPEPKWISLAALLEKAGRLYAICFFEGQT